MPVCFFESGPNIMSGLAADCNTLASKYNVDVNEERAIDQVFHFTDDDELRAAVAEQGYGLDKLVHDDAVIVRDAVAKQGYGLDILIDDNNRDVRMTVAHQCYGLDKLINDDYWGVRAEIANRGYGLDKLIHDEEPKARLLAYDALRAEEEQQKSNQQGKRRVLFVQDNYDDEIENSEFDFDV